MPTPATAERYHATVRSIPSRSDVFASNPNSSRALVASTLLLGCPFGFDVSQTIAALVADHVGDEFCELADRDLARRAEVDRLRAVVSLRSQDEAVDAVVDVEELPGRRAVAPQHDLVLGLDHLPDQRRDDVRRLEVEVVTRPVQIRRQQEDRIDPVLLAIRLRPDEKGLLRDAVRGVRLLRVAVPEVVLAERDGGELRVRANGPDDDELRRRVEPRLLEDIARPS